MPQRHRTAWIPALLMATTVFVLSSIPGQRIPVSLAHGLDKVAHASIYSVLGLTVALGLHRGRGMGSRAAVIVATVVIGALYGATDEVHQLFTPHRSFEVLDGLADTIGSLIGALLYVGWWSAKDKRKDGG